MIELGLSYKDKITGFRGICTGMCFYLTGCNQALLTPPVKENGDYSDGKWFDFQRLEVIEGTTKVILDNGDTPGFGETPSREY